MNAKEINKIREDIVELRETKQELDELKEIKNNYQKECRSYLQEFNKKQYDLILKLDHAHASWNLSESDKEALQDVIKYLVTKLVDSYLQEKNCYLLDIEGDEEIEKFIAMYNKHSDVDFETVNKQLDAALLNAINEGIKHYDNGKEEIKLHYKSLVDAYLFIYMFGVVLYCPFYTSSHEMETAFPKNLYLRQKDSSHMYNDSFSIFNNAYEEFYPKLIKELASDDGSVKARLLPQLETSYENKSLISFLLSLSNEDKNVLDFDNKNKKLLKIAFLYELAITSTSVENIPLNLITSGNLELIIKEISRCWWSLERLLCGGSPVCDFNEEVQKVLDSKLKQVKNAIEQTEQAIEKTQDQETLCQWLKSVS